MQVRYSSKQGSTVFRGAELHENRWLSLRKNGVKWALDLSPRQAELLKKGEIVQITQAISVKVVGPLPAPPTLDGCGYCSYKGPMANSYEESEKYRGWPTCPECGGC